MCARYSDRREFLAGMGLAPRPCSVAERSVPRRRRPRRTPRGHQPVVRRRHARSRQKAAGHVARMRNWPVLAACGINGLEPGSRRPSRPKRWPRQLTKHGLEMRSVYTGSELLDPATAEKEIERIVALAKRAKAVGTKIIVTNPSPLPNRQGKTDEQLKTQAAGLNQTGARVGRSGLTLAYHNHDVELQHAAREFHHMMLGTEPGCLSLCLDAHWVYRGAGHSQVALFDVVKLYGSARRRTALAPVDRATSGAKPSATGTSTIAPCGRCLLEAGSSRSWSWSRARSTGRLIRSRSPRPTAAAAATRKRCSRGGPDSGRTDGRTTTPRQIKPNANLRRLRSAVSPGFMCGTSFGCPSATRSLTVKGGRSSRRSLPT